MNGIDKTSWESSEIAQESLNIETIDFPRLLETGMVSENCSDFRKYPLEFPVMEYL